jgi:mannose-6-phosphate isomerase-like protein (cupin superfamily)
MKSKLETPWGYEGILVSTDSYSCKILLVKEGERTPYCHYKKQDKTAYVLQGIIQMTIEGTTRTFGEGDRYHIRPSIMHRYHSVKGDATILEIGTKLEDDMIIFEDDYSSR